MLAATRLVEPKSPERFQRQIDDIKELYGIDHQHLESLLDTKIAV